MLQWQTFSASSNGWFVANVEGLLLSNAVPTPWWWQIDWFNDRNPKKRCVLNWRALIPGNPSEWWELIDYGDTDYADPGVPAVDAQQTDVRRKDGRQRAVWTGGNGKPRDDERGVQWWIMQQGAPIVAVAPEKRYGRAT